MVVTSYEPQAAGPGTRRTRIAEFMAQHGVASYDALLERAEDPDWFYPAAFAFLDLGWLRPFDEVEIGSNPAWTSWFTGGLTNLAWLAADRWLESDGERTAVIGEAESGEVITWSVRDLAVASQVVARRLTELGVGIGDRVAMLLPMCPAATAVLLGAARIGAITVPLFTGYSASAIADRLRACTPRAILTCERASRGGKVVALSATARAAAAELDNAVEVSVVEDILAASPARSGAPIDAVALPANSPFLLAFTSGSTGRPKGALHAHGGFPYRLAIDLAFGFDVRPRDRFGWITDMGWIMGTVTAIGPLVLGATSVMIAGQPTFPDRDRVWRVVRDQQINQLGLSPTLVRQFSSLGAVPSMPLESLRIVGVTGEPCTLPAWSWLDSHVTLGAKPIINWAGGTEVGAGLLMGSPIVATPPTRFAGASPGIALRALGADGNSVVDTPGELVVTRPSPSMTRGLWNEPDRYLASYWARNPGVWTHGDIVIHHSDGSWSLTGRLDDVIKVAGKRVDPTELEAAACEVAGVHRAAAVGVPDSLKGEQPVVLIQADGLELDGTQLERQVRDRVRERIGAAFTPKRVLRVAELPEGRSGKVLRRLVRDWLLETEPTDTTSLANPGSRAEIWGALKRP